jgi:hypothetical protein
VSFPFDLHSGAVSDSHLLCHAYAAPMPCTDHTVLLKVTAQHGRRETACGLPARVRLLPVTTRSSTKIVIRSIQSSSQRSISATVRPPSHVPVLDRPGTNWPGESTTWNFNNISGSNRPVESKNAVTKQSCMHSVLQWIVIQLVLCSCTLVVNIDVTGCTGFIQ